MSANLEISLRTARQLAIRKQLLDSNRRVSGVKGKKASKTDLMRVFNALRCVQIDPIRAVERTELLVLWSRLGTFSPQDLQALTFDDKLLFEDWAHCASIVLLEDLPLFQYVRSSKVDGTGFYASRMRDWLRQNQLLIQHMRQELKEKGPLSTAEFSQNVPHVPWTSSGWNSGRSIPRILNHLFKNNEVMVAGREGNRKYWELTEKFLPANADTKDISSNEMSRRGLQLSLRSLGVGTPRHIYNHFIRKAYPNWQSVLRDLEADGLHVPVGLRTAEGSLLEGAWFIHKEDVELVTTGELEVSEDRTVLLSPFDNLICDRQRTSLLFDFDYTIEIYVPKAKRKYGYYVLPILMEEVFLGRVDLQMDRKQNLLMVNALFLEEAWRTVTDKASALANNIQDLAFFLGAREVRLGRRMPLNWRRALRPCF